jgi:hypothetical protein
MEIDGLTNLKDLTVVSGGILLLLALVVGSVSGAISATVLGGKDIGNQLCVLMGSSFGPVAAVPGTLLGLIVLKAIFRG